MNSCQMSQKPDWVSQNGGGQQCTAVYDHVRPSTGGFFLMNAEIDGQTVKGGLEERRCLIHRHCYSPEATRRTVTVNVTSSWFESGAEQLCLWTVWRRSREVQEEKKRRGEESIHTGAEHPHLGWGCILPSVGGACQAAPGSAAVCCVCGSTWDA